MGAPEFITVTFNGVSRKFAAAKLTTAALSVAFNLEMETISLMDDDGVLYQQSNGKFTGLIKDKEYDAYGDQKMAIVPKVQFSLAEVQAMQDQVTIQTRDMHERLEGAALAPQAVSMIRGLTILAACTSDPSLLNDVTKEIFVKLTSPKSFKASLFQVIVETTRKLKESMRKLKRSSSICEPNGRQNRHGSITPFRNKNKRQLEKQERICKEAMDNYKDQANSMGNLGRIFAACMLDTIAHTSRAIVDASKSSISLVAETAKNIATAPLRFISKDFHKYNSSLSKEYEGTLAQVVESYCNEGLPPAEEMMSKASNHHACLEPFTRFRVKLYLEQLENINKPGGYAKVAGEFTVIAAHAANFVAAQEVVRRQEHYIRNGNRAENDALQICREGRRSSKTHSPGKKEMVTVVESKNL